MQSYLKFILGNIILTPLLLIDSTQATESLENLTYSETNSSEVAESQSETPEPTNIQEISEIPGLIKQINLVYENAKESFASGNYTHAESLLREIIALSVNPNFPQTKPQSSHLLFPYIVGQMCPSSSRNTPRELRKDLSITIQCDDGSLQRRIIPGGVSNEIYPLDEDSANDRVVLLDYSAGHVYRPITLGSRIENGILVSIESLIQTPVIEEQERLRLEENREQMYRLGSDSLQLLQLTLINQKSPNFVEALEVSELRKELEYSRLSPLLNLSATVLKPEVPSIVDISNIQQIAREQEITVVYYSIVSKDTLYIWIIQPDGEIQFNSVSLDAELASISELIELARRATASYVDRGEADTGYTVWARGLRSIAKTGQIRNQIVLEDEQLESRKKLYRLLIEPIEKYLPPENSQIVVVPQGPFFSVPFAALLDESDRTLIERYSIRVAPSLKVLEQSSRKIANFPSGKDALIVGNPQMPSIKLDEDSPLQQLPTLLGAEAEALALADLLGTQPLTNQSATETYVRQQMSDARIIHLATHGILDNRNLALANIDLAEIIENEYAQSIQSSNYISELANSLLPGAVALTQSGAEDGLLTATEILGLELDAELIVMSACNTARGVSSESTVLGLPYALGASGASRVVVSLWSVPDKPTQSLMQTFYADMKKQAETQQEVDPAAALRYAMLEIKQQEEFKDPVNWAGFALIEVAQEN